jgi:hypothetical protein
MVAAAALNSQHMPAELACVGVFASCCACCCWCCMLLLHRCCCPAGSQILFRVRRPAYLINSYMYIEDPQVRAMFDF